MSEWRQFKVARSCRRSRRAIAHGHLRLPAARAMARKRRQSCLSPCGYMAAPRSCSDVDRIFSGCGYQCSLEARNEFVSSRIPDLNCGSGGGGGDSSSDSGTSRGGSSGGMGGNDSKSDSRGPASDSRGSASSSDGATTRRQTPTTSSPSSTQQPTPLQTNAPSSSAGNGGDGGLSQVMQIAQKCAPLAESSCIGYCQWQADRYVRPTHDSACIVQTPACLAGLLGHQARRACDSLRDDP